MLKKIWMLSGSLAAITGPILATISCLNKKEDDNAYEKIIVGIEASQKDILDKAMKKLTEVEKKRIQIIEVDALKYLDTLITKPQAAQTADIFSFPIDRLTNLVNAQILTKLKTPEHYDPSLFKGSPSKIGNDYYAYPINTETIFQIYKSDVNGVQGLTDKGYDTFENAIKDSKFVAEMGNLWYALPIINSAIVKNNNIPNNFSDQWTKKDDKEKWEIAFKNNNDVQNAIKDIWKYNDSLRYKYDIDGNKKDPEEANVDWKVNVANNENKERAKIILDNFINENVNGFITGPWDVNKIIAKIIKSQAHTDNLKATKINNIKAAKLFTYKGNPSRHVKGGWMFGINRLKLAKSKSISEKLDIQAKLLKALTSKDLANDWFTKAGRISFAKDATINLSVDEIKKIEIKDPDENDKKISLKDISANLANAINSLYQSILQAVSEQDKLNVEGLTGPAKDKMWNPFDAQTISNKEITTQDGAWTSFINKWELGINTIKA